MKNAYNLIEDVSTITTIPGGSLKKLWNIMMWSMCDYIELDKLQGEDQTSINIGFGTLIISTEDNQVQYKFIPSQKFESGVVGTVVNGKNPLVKNLEDTLVNRFTKCYKDMF